jgi:hypothetical protein
MQDSVFALCPKGHSVEQFRIYEAIESGAIPVLEANNGKLQAKMPETFLEDSGILIVDDWANVARAMVNATTDKVAINTRQTKLQTWYKAFMVSKLVEIEQALENKQHPLEGSVC